MRGSRQVFGGVARNLLLAGLLFLPLFLAGMATEIEVRNVSPVEGVSRGYDDPGESFTYQLSGWGFFYISMLLPVLLGATVHSIALLLIPFTGTAKQRRLTAVAMSPLVPCASIVFRISGWEFYSEFLMASIISTLVYGLTCSAQLRVRESP